MSPPRRSSRLRDRSTTPGKPVAYTPNHLASLAEHEETPTRGAQFHLDAVLSSPPLAPSTPTTAGRIKPSREEMHPSKAHQSTARELDEGLHLGFTDIKPKPGQPSGLSQVTPSKTGISAAFDFRFAHPGPQLGPDAQRMMDELREEAMRIKEKLAAERAEELKKNGGNGIEGRKFAQPKGKAGRFSDVHMTEFKKMDSIAGHPSSFRAQPDRVTPAKNTLKRTQSKAKLDERDEASVVTPAKNILKRTQSKAKLDEREDTGIEQTAEKPNNIERLENAAPAKRARKNISDDTSSARPVSRDGGRTVKLVASTSSLHRSQSIMPSSITTPTKASLARAANAKASTQIPTLSRSPSKPNLNITPQRMTKSATMNDLRVPKSAPKSFLRSPSKFERVRSILRYPSSSRKPAVASSAIPTLNKSASKLDLQKSLPPVPTTPIARTTKSIKHVNFTPDTANPHAAMIANSPSPIKSGIPRSTSKINLGATYRAMNHSPTKESLYPSLDGHPALAPEVKYPTLATPRPLPEPPRQARTEPRPAPPVPGTFTFRSDHTMNFGTPPGGFGSSPGQSSVRKVRPSFFPGTSDFPDVDKENIAPLPSIPHGMPNKKRRRADSDDEVEEKEVERSPKKHKAAEVPMLTAPKAMRPQASPRSKMQSPTKKKSGISLSRLNMLARPKARK